MYTKYTLIQPNIFDKKKITIIIQKFLRSMEYQKNFKNYMKILLEINFKLLDAFY